MEKETKSELITNNDNEDNEYPTKECMTYLNIYR